MDLFLDQGAVAERPFRGERGVAPAHAVFTELFAFELQVEAELALEVVGLSAASAVAAAVVFGSHGLRLCYTVYALATADITEAIALASRFQRDSSAASCFRPSGVSR